MRVASGVRLSLVAVAILAAALRVWGLTYGLPHPLARPDEEIIVGRAVQLSFDPHSSAVRPLLVYEKTAVTGVPIRPDVAMVFPYPDLVYLIDALALLPWRSAIEAGRPDLAYTVCRAVGALCGVATVFATFFAAFHAFRRRDVALVAAILIAVNFLHARDSHYATVDVPLSLFVTLALGFALKAASTERRRDVLLSAASAGLAASAKYNGAAVILATIVAAARRFVRPGTPHDRRRVLATLSIAALVMIGAFAVTSPWCIRYYQLVSLGLKHQRDVLFGGEGTVAWKILLSSTLPNAFGWPGLVAVAAGMLRAVWKRRLADLVLLAFVVPAFLSMAGMTWVLPRYPILLLPALCVLAAEAALAVLPAARSAWTIAVVAVVAALAASPLASIIAYDRLAAQTDTRILASKWMVGADLRIRGMEHIAVCRGYGAPVMTDERHDPPRFLPENVPCTLTALQDANAGFRFVVTHDHPYVKWFGPPDDVRRWLEAKGKRIATFTPFRSETGMEDCFAPGDVFYLPSCRFGQVDRGGPIITIWDLGAR